MWHVLVLEIRGFLKVLEEKSKQGTNETKDLKNTHFVCFLYLLLNNIFHFYILCLKFKPQLDQ